MVGVPDYCSRKWLLGPGGECGAGMGWIRERDATPFQRPTPCGYRARLQFVYFETSAVKLTRHTPRVRLGANGRRVTVDFAGNPADIPTTPLICPCASRPSARRR